MTHQLVIMDFTGAYEQESFYRHEWFEWIDCKDIPGTRYICDDEAKVKLEEKIKDYGPNGIHFIDSGNYHYMSKLWTDKIREPFVLVVFDHHPDMQPTLFGELMSCGCWVKEVLDTNKYVQKVVIVGAADELLQELSLQNPSVSSGDGAMSTCIQSGEESSGSSGDGAAATCIQSGEESSGSSGDGAAATCIQSGEVASGSSGDGAAATCIQSGEVASGSSGDGAAATCIQSGEESSGSSGDGAAATGVQSGEESSGSSGDGAMSTCIQAGEESSGSSGDGAMSTGVQAGAGEVTLDGSFVAGRRGRRMKGIGSAAEYRDRIVAYSESSMNQKEVWQEFANEHVKYPVYISIDKDVLKTEDAVTDWDSGSMSLEQLTELLSRIVYHDNVIGVDICGECSDTLRLITDPEVVSLNNRSNKLILKRLFNALSQIYH